MTVFLVIGGIGLALVILTFLVGDLLDGVFDFDALDNDLFSLSSLAAFLGAFGFGGALGLSTTGNTAWAAGIGFFIGAAAMFGAIRLTRFLKSGEDAASFRSDSLVGHSGRVITSIPEAGYGEIRISVGGHIRKVAARSAEPIAVGSEVWVVSILSPTAVEVVALPTLP
ncbi:NfeD family protein [Corynebacterium freiburgense]|uniref:NfeD family protein n=1 Tax=Corynebacterium freiburgense TaxID=556548 RepID=UPI00041C5623|nr:NfeD family protein [Corynebacterium freiburgense]WJZ01420.1 putative membrane protein YuaF [Corynebacterium freiburgense]